MKKLMMMIAMFAIAGVASAALLNGDFSSGSGIMAKDSSIVHMGVDADEGWWGEGAYSTTETTAGQGGANGWLKLTQRYGNSCYAGQYFDVGSLVVGQNYQLEFWYQVNGDLDNSDNVLSFTVGEDNGANSGTTAWDRNNTNQRWQPKSGAVSTADVLGETRDITGGTIGWTKVTSGNFQIDAGDEHIFVGLYIDNVRTDGSNEGFVGFDSVSIVPEPATVGMLGLGALVALLIRRIRA